MRSTRWVGQFAAFGVLAVTISGPAGAGAAGCGERAIACYEKVRRPDIYETRTRAVVVRPGYSEVVGRPAIVVAEPQRMLVRPARAVDHVIPPVYGTRRQRILVAPPSKVSVFVPPVTKTVHERVVVHPGGVRWEYKRGLFGRDRLCKVKTKPVTAIVARDVIVRPGRHIVRETPAVYQTHVSTVVRRPAAIERIYEPARTAWVARPVIVRPASYKVIHHPAAVAHVRERVLVHEGGSGWVPVRRD